MAEIDKSTWKNKKLAVVVIVIVCLLAVVLLWQLSTYSPTGPNTDAEGFLISQEGMTVSGGYFYLYYIDNNFTGYEVILHPVFESSSLNYSNFELSGETFYYSDSQQTSSNVSMIKKIIMDTEFDEENWNGYYDSNDNYAENCYWIHQFWIIELSDDDVSNLTSAIESSDFKSFQHEYRSASTMGGGPSQITIPQFHKKVTVHAKQDLPSPPEGYDNLRGAINVAINY